MKQDRKLQEQTHIFDQLIFFRVGDQTQGFIFATQTLYH